MSDKTIIELKLKAVWQLPRGHRSHRSGAGVHGDRRTKRLRTRAAQKQSALHWQGME